MIEDQDQSGTFSRAAIKAQILKARNAAQVPAETAEAPEQDTFQSLFEKAAAFGQEDSLAAPVTASAPLQNNTAPYQSSTTPFLDPVSAPGGDLTTSFIDNLKDRTDPSNFSQAQKKNTIYQEQEAREKRIEEMPWYENFWNATKSGTRGMFSAISTIGGEAMDVFGTAQSRGMVNPLAPTDEATGPQAYGKMKRESLAGESDGLIGKGLRQYAKEQKEKAQEYEYDPESVSGIAGSVVPYVVGSALAIATAPFSAPLSAGIAAGVLVTNSMAALGSGYQEYDEYKDERGLTKDPAARLGMGLIYGTAEFAMERLQLNKFMPKAFKNKVGSVLFGGVNPEVLEKKATDLIKEFAQSSASRSKMVKDVIRQSGEGALFEGGTELATELTTSFSNWLYYESEDRELGEDFWKQNLMAFAGGSMMGAGLGPLSYASQRMVNNKRRKEAGSVVIAQDKESGESYEIVGRRAKPDDGGNLVYDAIRPNGKPIRVTQDQIGKVVNIPYDTFRGLLYGGLDGNAAVEAQTNTEVVGQAQTEQNDLRARYSPFTNAGLDGTQNIATGQMGGNQVFILGADPINADMLFIDDGNGGKKAVSRNQVSDIQQQPFEDFLNQTAPIPATVFDAENPIQKGEQIEYEGELFTVTGVNMETGQVQLELANDEAVDIREIPVDIFQQMRQPVPQEEQSLEPQQPAAGLVGNAANLAGMFPDPNKKDDSEVKESENNTEADITDQDQPLQELIGKTVRYQGMRGTLQVSENGKLEVVSMNGNRIYELPNEVTIDNLSKEIGIELIPEKTEKEKPRSIIIKNDRSVEVDGNEYSINTNELGNVVSLSYTNEIGQKRTIRDKELILAIDIERNKTDYVNNSDAQKSGRLKSEIIEDKSNDANQAIMDQTDRILSLNMNEGIEAVLDGNQSDEQTLLQAKIWVEDAIERVESYIESNNLSENIYLKNLTDNLYEAYQNIVTQGENVISGTNDAAITSTGKPGQSVTAGQQEVNESQNVPRPEDGADQAGQGQPINEAVQPKPDGQGVDGEVQVDGEITPVKKTTPVRVNGVMAIDEKGEVSKEFTDKIEELKANNDLKGLDETYYLVRVLLNGPAQSKGEKTVKAFEQLKKELEDYANQLNQQPDKEVQGGKKPLNIKGKPEGEVQADSAFELFENEGEWKVITTTYKGRDVGNIVYQLLDKKQRKDYDKLRDEIDPAFGTKNEAELSLQKLLDFEKQNKDAFDNAKKLIDQNQQPDGIQQTKPKAEPGQENVQDAKDQKDSTEKGKLQEVGAEPKKGKAGDLFNDDAIDTTPKPRPKDTEQGESQYEIGRKQGFNIKDGVRYERQKPIEAVKGKEVSLEFAKNVNEKASYSVVEASQVQPSHKKGQQNPLHFIPEAQPKNRKTTTSQKSAIDIANNLDPAKIAQSPNPYSGAPIINSRGEVIQGNNRIDGILQYWEVNAQDTNGYKQYLIDNAEALGLDAAKVKAMKSPVLTRMVQSSDTRAIELGNYDVKDIESGGKRRIDPIATSNKLSKANKAALVKMMADSSGNTLSEIVREQMGKITKYLYDQGAINSTQLETIINAQTGEVKPAGIEDISAIYNQFIFQGGNTNLPEAFNSLPSNVQKAIGKAIPDILNAPTPILFEIQGSIIAYVEFIESSIENFSDWMTQRDLFDGGQTPSDRFNPLSLQLVKIYDKAKTQSEITKLLKEYNVLTTGSQGDMFSAAKAGISPQEAVNKIFNVKNHDPIKFNSRKDEIINTDNSAPEQNAKGQDAGTSGTSPEIKYEQKPRSDSAGTSNQDEAKPTRRESIGGTDKGSGVNQNTVIDSQKGDIAKEGFFAFNSNYSKGQDAIFADGKTFIISDGMGSYAQSGDFAKALVIEIAKLIQKSKISILGAIPRVATKFTDAAATLSLVKRNKDGSIQYFSIGDSPIYVIDKDGKVKQKINENTNTATDGFLAFGDGKHVTNENRLITGIINPVKGDRIIVASDGFGDVFAMLPEDQHAALFESLVNDPEGVKNVFSESKKDDFSFVIIDPFFVQKENAIPTTAKAPIKKAADVLKEDAKPGEAKKPTLSEKEQRITDELKALWDDFGKAGNNKLNTGPTADQIIIAGKIIGKATELGFTKFEQVINWTKDNLGIDRLRDNFNAFKAAYVANLAFNNPEKQDLNSIANQTIEQYETAPAAERLNPAEKAADVLKETEISDNTFTSIKNTAIKEATLPKYLTDFFQSLQPSKFDDHSWGITKDGYTTRNARMVKDFFSYISQIKNDSPSKNSLIEILAKQGFDINQVDLKNTTGDSVKFKNGLFITISTKANKGSENIFQPGTQISIRDTDQYRRIKFPEKFKDAKPEVKKEDSTPKTVNIFGVELTPIQNMQYSKWRDNGNGQSPNTLTPQQRTKQVQDWLDSQNQDAPAKPTESKLEKQPFEMTKEEFSKSLKPGELGTKKYQDILQDDTNPIQNLTTAKNFIHNRLVQNAIAEGKIVPSNVLNEYPELVKTKTPVEKNKPESVDLKTDSPIYNGTNYNGDKVKMIKNPKGEYVIDGRYVLKAEQFETGKEYYEQRTGVWVENKATNRKTITAFEYLGNGSPQEAIKLRDQVKKLPEQKTIQKQIMSVIFDDLKLSVQDSGMLGKGQFEAGVNLDLTEFRERLRAFIETAPKKVRDYFNEKETERMFHSMALERMQQTAKREFEIGKFIRDKRYEDAVNYFTNPQNKEVPNTKPSTPTKKEQPKPNKAAELFPSEKSKGEKIDDVGEVISGAAKNQYQKQAENLAENDTERLAKEPLSVTIPEPNYQKLVQEGMIKEEDAITLKLLRADLGRKPSRRSQLNKWVESAKAYSDWIAQTLKGEFLIDNIGPFGLLKRANEKFKSYKSEALLNNVDLYKQLGWLSEGIDPGHYHLPTVTDGRHYVVKGNTIVSPDFTTRTEAIQWLKARRIKEIDAPKDNKMEFLPWSIGKLIFIAKKGNNKLMVKKGFATGAEARQYIKDNYQDLVDAYNLLKEIPELRRSENLSRLGEDRRNGKDIGAEEFMKTFGFRGVQFGNWVNNAERQSRVNDAYDSFMDLADVLKIPAKALGLNGELGMAFGARGKKGSSAHYESGQIVINLTKENGAGSLAHEWWHAFDNYMSRRRGEKGEFLSEFPRPSLKDRTRGPEQDITRREVFDAFININSAISKKTEQGKRSLKMDVVHNKKYYRETLEMTARAFESYVIDRLSAQQGRNDYLANIATEESFSDRPEIYPYPTKAEKKTINEAYDALFNMLKVDESNPKKPLYMLLGEQTETKAFKDWFGDSKVVDGDGKPLVVYHGTGNDFNKFDLDKTGSHTDSGMLGKGFYFSDSPKETESYAKRGKNPSVMPVYLSLQNPFITSNLSTLPQIAEPQTLEEMEVGSITYSKELREKLISMGYDGVVYNAPDGKKEIVSFYPTQIKSATGNTGAFDGTNPDIRYSKKAADALKDDGKTDSSNTAKLQKEVDRITDTWQNGPEIQVFENAKAIQAAYPDVDFRDLERVPGLFYDGKMILNAAHPFQRQPGSTESVILHESVGHYGMGKLIDQIAKKKGTNANKEYADLMQSVYDSFANHPLMAYVSKLYFGKDPAALTELEQIEAGDEFIAHSAQNGIQDKFIDKVIAKLREILRSLGFSMKMNDAELRAIIAKSARLVAGKPDGAAVNNGTRNMLNDTKTTETPEFKKWFGDSKVVDKDGEPMVVYHGTNQDFDVFDKTGIHDLGLWGKGYYFSAVITGPNSYALRQGDGANVMPVYVSIQNPLILKAGKDFIIRLPDGRDFRELLGDKLDGVKIKELALSQGNDGVIQYKPDGLIGDVVAYSPTQIKSATGNTGAFDGSNPDIRYSINDFVPSSKSKEVQDRQENESAYLNNPRYMIEPTLGDGPAADNSRREGFLSRALSVFTPKSAADKKRGEKPFYETFREGLQDAMLPGRRLIEEKKGKDVSNEADFYTKENLAADKVIFQITQFENDYIKPLKEVTDRITKEYKVTFEDTENYLIALHNDERRESMMAEISEKDQNKKDPKWPTGMTKEESDQIISLYEDKVPEEVRETLNEKREAIRVFALDKSLQSGLISQQYYDALLKKFKNYVPLKGHEDRIEYDVTKYSPIKKAKGRTSKAASPLAYLYASAADAIAHGERNLVFQSFLTFAKENPDNNRYMIKTTYYRKTKGTDGQEMFIEVSEEEATPTKEMLVKGEAIRGFNPEIVKDLQMAKPGELSLPIWVKGQKVNVIFSKGNEQLVKALKNTSYSKVEGVLKLGQKLNGYLSRAFTQYSPEFGLVNATRDYGLGSFSVIADDGIKTWKATNKRYAQSNADLMKYFWGGENISNAKNPYLKEFFESGAYTGFSQAKEVRDVYKVLSNKSKSSKVENSFPVKLLSSYNKSIENTFRFAYFQALRDQGLDVQKAAAKAKDVTVNFRRRGNWTSGMSALYAFFNAGVQGTERFTRPFFSKTPAVKQRAINFAGGLYSAGFMQGVLHHMLGSVDDEDEELRYDKIPEFTKNMNMLLPFPGKISGMVMVPLGYGMNIPFVMGEITAGLVLGKYEVGESLWRSLSVISDSFSPIGGFDFGGMEETPSQKVVKIITPTFAKPVLDLALNSNFAGFSIMSENPWDKTTPRSQKAKPNTSKAAVKVADFLNSATGGTPYEPGLVDINPNAMEYIFRQYGGGPVSFAEKVNITREVLFDGENPLISDKTRKVPFLSRFYTDTDNNSAVMNRYFKNRNKIQQSEEVYKNYLMDEKVGGAERYFEKNKDWIEMADVLKSYETALKDVNQDIKYLKANGEKEELKEMESLRSQIMKEFNKIINEEKDESRKAGDLLK